MLDNPIEVSVVVLILTGIAAAMTSSATLLIALPLILMGFYFVWLGAA